MQKVVGIMLRCAFVRFIEHFKDARTMPDF